MFNAANILTLSRVLAVPVIVALLAAPSPSNCRLAALVFLFAAVTDMVDGMVARSTNQVTSVGKFLDPLADKLLVASTLVMLVQLDWLPGWIAVVIICRELAVTGFRTIALQKGMVLAADKYGKMKTILQCAALIPLALHYPTFGVDPRPAGMALLYLALFLTVFSGANYLYNFHKNWCRKP